jgi:hypothetical protein
MDKIRSRYRSKKTGYRPFGALSWQCGCKSSALGGGGGTPAPLTGANGITKRNLGGALGCPPEGPSDPRSRSPAGDRSSS